MGARQTERGEEAEEGVCVHWVRVVVVISAAVEARFCAASGVMVGMDGSWGCAKGSHEAGDDICDIIYRLYPCLGVISIAWEKPSAAMILKSSGTELGFRACVLIPRLLKCRFVLILTLVWILTLLWILTLS